jgi:transglutaminase-like putative cysteine protease/tetratricopeptide (TPR) repeat protein
MLKSALMLKPTLLLLLCSLVTFTATGQGTRPPIDTSQEAAVIQQWDTRVRFENDGTGLQEKTAAILIQSQAGIEQYGQLVFGYSSATEKLEVTYVRVRKPGGQVVETPAANAQDFAPEVLRSAPMYSDYRERHVTVASLRPGDVLEYRTTTLITTPLATGEFWYEHRFPTHIAVMKARLEVDVPKTRELKLKSPNRKYTTTENGERRTYSWTVENIVPDRKDRNQADADEETDDSDDETPDVQLATFKDWQQVARWYAKLQGERVVIDDSIRKKAAELTAGAITPQEKAQRLYYYVAKDIRYVSLSFGVGRYQPHAAQEVMQGSYGDCKDKHTLLSALLRAAGIQSYPVLIDSSRKLDEDVPSPAQFDHVITAVKFDKDWTWLDATAEVAPYALILYPLRDKQALLASDDTNGGLRRTPATTPDKSILARSMDGKVSEGGALDATMSISATGDGAVFIRMAFRRTPQADWKRLAEYYALGQGQRGQVSDVQVKELEDTEKPFLLIYKYHEDAYFTVPSSAAAFFPLPALQLPRLSKPKPKEQLDLGPRMELHDTAHLQFAANYTLRLSPEVKLSRDYADYSLIYRFSGNTLEADRILLFKASKLPASRRLDVQSLRSVATNYSGQSITADVRPTTKAAGSTVASGNETPQELRKAGTKALQQKDFKTAVDDFNRLVDKDPKSDDGWNQLGRAYAGLNDHAKAADAYRKQAEVNPFHKSAYNHLGAELQRMGKYDDALAAYGKQLENVPVDRVAGKQHALLLARLNHKEALHELEAVNAAVSDDPEIELALARLYAANGIQDKSQALMKSVVGSPNIANGDLFAAALRDDIQPDESMEDAKNIVDTVSEQIESGEYEAGSSGMDSAMYFVALEWARIGWAKYLKGETLESIRFLDSAWLLSQSGTLANRLARVYQKAGDKAKAKHFLLLAVAAGGSEAEISRAELTKLGGAVDLAQAQAELMQMRKVKLPGLKMEKGEAEFSLVFSGSNKAERADFAEGDPGLLSAEQALIDATFSVSFPDVSSVKIVRRGVLSCGATGCAIALKPIESAGLFMGTSTQK